MKSVMAAIFKPAVLTCIFLLVSSSGHSGDITRERVIENASAYVNLKWQCTKQNARKAYNHLSPGRQYKGVPYNFGGFDSTEMFIRKIKKGVIAGNTKKRCGKYLCTFRDFAGLDCSGLVSRCFEIGRYSTSTFQGISIKIPRELLRQGDILNSVNKHVMLFDKFDDENQMWVYESATWIRSKNTPPAGAVYRSVDLGDDYVPRRYYKFIGKGERIKTNRTIVAINRLDGKEKKYIPSGTKGVIMEGPTVRDNRRGTAFTTDIWVYVDFDNGRKGWTTIRHLTLIAANPRPR